MRRVCLAVTGMLLSASTIHLLNIPAEPASVHLVQILHDLQAMAVNHQFAARCVEIIRSLATKWRITLPDRTPGGSVFHLPNQQSPTASAFFASSIPRKQSSGTGTRSNTSTSSQQNSPFGPPGQHHPQQQQQPIICGEPTALDPTQSQDAFWTPFPVQGMPARAHTLQSSLLDFMQMAGSQEWSSFGINPGHDPGFQALPHSVPVTMAENLGGAIGDWSWSQG